MTAPRMEKDLSFTTDFTTLINAKSDFELCYPTAKDYPTDAVCEKIVRALEKHQWSVPSIDIEFHVIRSRTNIFSNVHTIKGETFNIWFNRVQGEEGCLKGDLLCGWKSHSTTQRVL